MISTGAQVSLTIFRSCYKQRSIFAQYDGWSQLMRSFYDDGADTVVFTMNAVWVFIADEAAAG